jgi:FkbM family methyltransferase
MEIPANHHLPWILRRNPKWSQSLVHTVKALGAHVRLIDVGANVGDTVVMLEEALPGVCESLCIEPDPRFVELCRKNTHGIEATVVQTFVSDERRWVRTVHHVPGTAFSAACSNGVEALPLDEVARQFASENLALIKIDTDGYEFKILRSAAELIASFKPALFFELAPRFWDQAGEESALVFDWLAKLGYFHYALFTDDSFLYCSISNPSPTFVRSIIESSRTRHGMYFDVLATHDEQMRDRTVAINLHEMSAG